MPDLPLSGQLAVVTGGASGIGRASALALARAGASLAIADLNEEGGRAACKEIAESGGSADRHVHYPVRACQPADPAQTSPPMKALMWHRSGAMDAS